MANRKEMDFSISRLPTRAWQHALIELDDEPGSATMVARALDQLVTHYAHTIKDDFPRLFYRIFLNALYRVKHQHDRGSWSERLAAALIPRREETTTPHPLENLSLTDPAHDPDWSRRAESRTAVVAALRLLPHAQRTAFLLLDVDALSPADAAFAAGCSRRALLRSRQRAVATLEAIFAVKGSTLSDAQALAAHLTQAMPSPSSGQAAALAAAAGSCHARMTSLRRKPIKLANRLAGWSLRHPGGKSALVLLSLSLLAASALYLTRPAPAPDTAQTDIRLLAGEVPLDVLVDPHFDEAKNE